MHKLIDYFTPFQIYLFHEGTNYDAHELLGAHLCEVGGVWGCRFGVWAPRAKNVQVCGDWSGWALGAHPMEHIDGGGIWAAFVPGVSEFAHYKYYITTSHGKVLEKADPYAFWAEQPLNNASRVVSLDYKWGDGRWMRTHKNKTFLDRPMNIYEVHVGSWKRTENNEPYTYSQLAQPLLDYVCDMGYTHIELLPVTEYPLEDSWGYQVTGYFAPTSRYGKPQDLMYFIDCCHQRGVGVILDWVPSHFPKDAFALAKFDGYPLYEYRDPRVGEHKQWGTLVFDYGRKEVLSFLISSAMFWAEKYHADGFRVDAVTSMLYLNYMRTDFICNRFGGNENLEALAFLRTLNTAMNERCPGVLMIAEEATDWDGVTRPVNEGGMGFDLKWNMGWMNDILRYMMRDPAQRKHHHSEITFSMMYAFRERYILPLSHDEVVHSELSMVDKMPGDYWQKFANLRLLYAYMYTHPGKKLLFMGNEFAPFMEWRYYEQLEWFMLQYDAHGGMQRFVRELNILYKSQRCLWQNETDWGGFEWVNPDDREDSVIAYVRYDRSRRQKLVVLCNFTPAAKEDFRIGLPAAGRYRELLNTDDARFGGSGVTNDIVFKSQRIPWDKRRQSLALRLPPLGCVILEKLPEGKDGEEIG